MLFSLIKVLLSQVDERKPQVDGLSKKAGTVVDNNEDATVVKSAVNKILRPEMENVETTTLRLKKRREKLRQLFTKHGEVDEVIESFSDRLKVVERKQDQQRPVSAIFEVVRKQRSNSDAVVADITDLTVGYKDLERKVHEFVDKEHPQKDKDRVIDSFEKVKQRFEKVKEEGSNKAKKTKDVELPAHVHNDKYTEFVAWLEDIEKKLKDTDKKGASDKESEEVSKKRKEILKVGLK